MPVTATTEVANAILSDDAVVGVLCPECDQPCANNTGLSAHLRTVHDGKHIDDCPAAQSARAGAMRRLAAQGNPYARAVLDRAEGITDRPARVRASVPEVHRSSWRGSAKLACGGEVRVELDCDLYLADPEDRALVLAIMDGVRAAQERARLNDPRTGP